MKILWLCNIVMPELSELFGFKKDNFGGWLVGAWHELKKSKDLELAICVPIKSPERMEDGSFEGYKFYSFLMVSRFSSTTVNDQIERFEEILSDFQPDVVHIWGTEYEHSYSMVKACEKLKCLEKVVVNLQGFVFFLGEKYTFGIEDKYLNRDVNGITLEQQKHQFMANSGREIETLSLVKNVIGRTDFDRNIATEINKDINYIKIGEILRPQFYESEKWRYEECKKHSIFISQAGYPIKGLHLILESLAKLKKIYPDLTVEIGGSPLKEDTPYGYYIYSLIRKYDIEGIISFCGLLDACQMIDKYLSANVFLSPSILENSSNSICEAMMLGVPVVASNTGGTLSMVKDGLSGYLYSLGNNNAMIEHISKVFNNSETIGRLSECEIKMSKENNDKEKIVSKILNVYIELCNGGE